MANSDILVRMRADTKNYDANIAKARRQLDQFKRDNLSLGGVMKQTTSVMTSMAASYMGVYAAIRGMQKVVGDMVRINKEFEQSTANLASIMGKSTEEISALTNQAKQLGATTKYTAMQITELQTNLARLGFTQQEILNSTTAVQALATATGADLGEAANLAGAALRGFGLNATEMERVASVLSVSTTKSALSFEKLATAVPIVAPVAKQFGFTIEDTVTLLAKLSDAGMDASTAATATRNIFLKMANDSGKLAQALGRPVHSVEEFGEALAEMRKKGMSLNDILSMVGVRSTAAFAVFADNAETLKDFKDSITDCSDAMHDMESKQLNTLQGSITILNSAWEGLMLTFSESNGVIKTVVDSLTSLLGAWTKWRQRNAGGDTAIKSYQLYGSGLDNEAKQGMQEIVKGYKAGGSTDEQIVAQFTKEKEAIEKERDAARQLYDQLAELDKLKGKQHDVAQTAWNKQFAEMFKNEKYGYNLQTDGAAPDYILRQIAKMEDEIAKKDYGVDLLTAPEQGKQTSATDDGKDEDRTKSRLATLKAQYEEQEKAQIASLDRMAMNEADYEAQVYKIKRETLQKIADLYQEETAEKARANAAISQLDIAYQGTQMRLANRSNGSASKPKEEKLLNYSQEGIANLGSQIKSQMSKSEIGSEGYLLAADQLLDFTTFENLLKTATEKGVQIDPEWMASLFEDVKIGADVDESTWQALVDNINAKLEELDLPPIKLNIETGAVEQLDQEVTKTIDHVGGAAQAFSALGNAMNQIDDPGAKVAGMIAEAIGSVAAGYGAATAQAATMGPWAWIAFAVTGLATMISTIAAIKSATSAGSYAGGGLIGGNSFSGDNLTANVNSGELILNRAQQGSIASQLQGAAQQTVIVEGRISGKDILLSANNTNRAAGGSRGYYTKVK